MERSFTKVIDLLFQAKQNDFEIVLKGERLQLKIAENKPINQTLLDEIKDNKQSIIDFLSNKNWRSSNVSGNHKAITRFDRNQVTQVPLSFSQERLWFIDQLEGSVQYHSPVILRLSGELNFSALEHSLKTIITRHEVLRTIFREEGGQVMQIVRPESEWQLQVIDGIHFNDSEENLRDFIATLVRQPFSLSADYLLRGSVIKLSSTEHILVVTMHHIASDAWSLSILIKEVL